MPTTEERVSRLEFVLEEFIKNVEVSHMRTEAEIRDLKDEMKDFKDEMKDFKDEMKDFKDEMKDFKDEMKDFKDEMKDFKDEMKDFKDEMKDFKDEMKDFKDEVKEQNREMNKRWGEMANKLGTITEDLVVPSLPRIIKEEMGIEVEDLMVRRKKRLKDGRVKEYDAVAVGGDYVFVNYTKSTLKAKDIGIFINEIQGFREILQEYRDKRLIGILSSLYVDKTVIRHAEKAGFMILSVGDELMDVKNTKGFKPKEW